MLKYEYDWSSTELISLSERSNALAFSSGPLAAWIILPAAFVVISGMLGAWLGAGRSLGWDSALLGYSAAGAGLGLTLSYVVCFFLNRWFGRFSRFPVWRGRIVWELSEANLTVLREGYDFTCAWARIDAVVIDDGDIFVVIAGTVFILPERAFAQPADKRAAYEFMWERLGASAQALSQRLQAGDALLDLDT